MRTSPARAIRSDRVALDPICSDDAGDIIALHSDSRVTRHLLDGIPDDARKAEIYLRWAVGLQAEGIGPWAARRRGSSVFLGLFTLTPVDDRPDLLEFGGRMARAAWSGDLAVEAGAALIDHAFARLGCAGLVSVFHPENRTAPVALARLGFGSERPVTMFGRAGVEVALDPAAWEAQGRAPRPAR